MGHSRVDAVHDTSQLVFYLQLVQSIALDLRSFFICRKFCFIPLIYLGYVAWDMKIWPWQLYVSTALSATALSSLLWPENRERLFKTAAKVNVLNQANWREWLLSSLRDSGRQPEPDRFIIIVITFIGMGTVGGLVRLTNSSLSSSLGGSISGILPVVALILSPLYPVLIQLNWRARSRSAEQELLRLGSRKPILYLRSFGLDEVAARTETTASEYLLGHIRRVPEQDLVYILRKCGPVIAIGRPNERLPPLGAARFYVSEDRWQEKVTDVVKVSQLIVWATRVTEGLRWEFRHLVKNADPRKIVLWTHPHLLNLGESERETEWQRFRSEFGKIFPRLLPERLGEARFIYFDSSFEPFTVVPGGFGNALRSATRRLLKAKGLPEKRSHRERLRLLAPGLVGALIVLVWTAVVLSKAAGR